MMMRFGIEDEDAGVYRHLDLVKSKLQSDDAKARQGWLRLLKEVCDFVAVT